MAFFVLKHVEYFLSLSSEKSILYQHKLMTLIHTLPYRNINIIKIYSF